MMSVRDIERIVERKLSRFRLLAELVTDVVWGDKYFIATGKGVADHDLQADDAGRYGFYSRPLDGGEAIVLKLDGEGNSSFVIGYRDRQHEVTIEKGEVLVRDDQGQLLHLKRDGVYIDGQQIILKGGTKGAARVDDPILPGNLAIASAGPVLGVYTVSLIYTPPGGAPVVIGSWPTAGAATSGNVDMGGKIAAGSADVKVG